MTKIDREHYERADKWVRVNVAKLVKNIMVDIHWIGESDEFWYRRETADGHEFTIVDAATGDKRPAFDHAALTEAWAADGREDLSATKLPFARFEFSEDRNKITFSHDGHDYRFELSSGDLHSSPIPAVDSGLLLSPDKSRAVRTVNGNLKLVNRISGDQRELTHDGQPDFGYGVYYGNWKASHIPRKRAGGDESHPPMATHWAPDSRHLLVSRLDQRHVAPYPMLETAPDDGSYRPKVHLPRIPLTGEEPAHVEWFVIDTRTGRQLRLDLPYENLFYVHQDMLAVRRQWWSDDCSRLYLLCWGDLIRSAHIYEIELGSGAVREVFSEAMSPRMETSASTYDPPAVHLINGQQELIWFSQRSGWGHLYLYDVATGELKNPITQGDWVVRDIIKIDEASRRVYFTAGGSRGGNPYLRHLYRVNLDGTDLVLLTPEEADNQIEAMDNDVLAMHGRSGDCAISPSGTYVVYDHSTIDRPTESVIRRTDNGEKIATFEQCDASALYEAGWENPESFVVKADDGQTDLYGVIYKPRNLDESGKYPLIDSQYASPLTAVVPHNFARALGGVPGLAQPASLTELGFVSFSVDARGTTYRNRKFGHHSWQNLNEIGLYDHIAAMRQLHERFPWMDLERVGIHGGSYGGYTVHRAMLEFPDDFHVGISCCGMGTAGSMYPDYHWESYHGMPEYESGGRRRPAPDAVAENFRNNDTSLQAENLKGRLLLMIGELDENVLPGTTLQFARKLMDLDLDFDMIYTPNQPHNLGIAFNVRKCWDYFVRYLHGVEPPRYQITSFKTNAKGISA